MRRKTSMPEGCPATFIENVARGFQEQCTNRILIDSHERSPHGTIVRGTCRGGACVEFLAPGLSLSCSQDESRSFFVYGVASEIRKANVEPFLLRRGPLVQCLKLAENASKPYSEPASVTLSLEGARYLVRSGDIEYEFSFATVVESIDSFDFLGSRMFRMHTILMLPDDIPFHAILLAPDILLKGYEPSPGDAIQGALLLFGLSQ